MRIEDQVTSIELAKRLKELGVKQESVLYWLEEPNLKGGFVLIDNLIFIDQWKKSAREYCSAFTVAELGEMMGDYGHTRKIATVWASFFHRKHCTDKFAGPAANTEADARAAMLCYLIEQGLVKTDGGKND